MKKYILFIFLTGFLESFGLNRNNRRKLQVLLWDKYRLQTSFSKIGVHLKEGIIIEDLIFYYSKMKISLKVRKVSLGFNWVVPVFVKLVLGKLKKTFRMIHHDMLHIQKTKQKERVKNLSEYIILSRLHLTLTHLFEFIPDSIILEDCQICIEPRERSGIFLIRSLSLKNSWYQALLAVSAGNGYQEFEMKGQLVRRNKRMTFHLKKISPVAHLSNSFKNKIYWCNLEECTFFLKETSRSNGVYEFEIGFSGESLFVSHPKISSEPFLIPSLTGNVIFKIGLDCLTIHELSKVVVNQVPVTFYLDFKTSDQNIFQLLISFRDISVEDFFSSFPHTLSKPLSLVSAEGHMNFFLAFKCDLRDPLNHLFSAKLDTSFIREWKFGNAAPTDLSLLFSHVFIGKGGEQRQFILEKGYEGFIPLDEISPYLVKTIICTEDPYFFNHNGIDVPLMGFALASNLKERKFGRGGSTITMQVARNLFLHHQRNILRKLEEISIALIMENVGKLPKERILEIYLNIVEWAPGIYGISEASEFYFSKSPSKLSLKDCLVLSYILPRPQFFVAALLDRSPQLKKKLYHHIRRYSLGMVRTGLIDPFQEQDMEGEIVFGEHLGRIKV